MNSFYITISDYKNDKTIDLLTPVLNSNKKYYIALTKILYYPKWYNISQKLKNNTFLNNDDEQVIPDGYYNVRKLNTFFKTQGCNLTINESTGKLKLKTFGNIIILTPELAETLGFYKHNDVNRDVFSLTISDESEGFYLPKLINHKEMFVHLDCVNSTYNLYNYSKSTVYEETSVSNSNILTSIPVECEEINTGKKIEFTNPEYKELAMHDIHNMKISILDSDFKKLDFEYLSLTLHIKKE